MTIMTSSDMSDDLEATAHDRVLRILVPKAAKARAKNIQVQPGKARPAVTGAAVVKNGG